MDTADILPPIALITLAEGCTILTSDVVLPAMYIFQTGVYIENGDTYLIHSRT